MYRLTLTSIIVVIVVAVLVGSLIVYTLITKAPHSFDEKELFLPIISSNDINQARYTIPKNSLYFHKQIEQ